jgi:hypothetical protein
MGTRRIEKVDWSSYFDRTTKLIAGGNEPKQAEIRILAPTSGAQVESDWKPLLGITYDHKDNLLEVAMEDLDHLIVHPDDIFIVEGSDGSLRSFEVVEGDTRHIVELR